MEFLSQKEINCSVFFILSALFFLTGCQPKEINSAKIYIQGNQWDKALEQLETAVELHPKNPEVHFLLGQAYARKGLFKDMNREFELSLLLSNKFEQNILAEREKYWIEKYNAGITKLGADEFEDAEVLLRTAILIDATRAEAYKKLAVSYLNMNKEDKALQLYNKLMEKHPNDIDLLASTANLFYFQGEYSKVIPILNRILSIEPNHRDALANLALSYDSLGETEKAYDAYQNAIRVNPEDKDLVFLFAVHHYKRQRYKEAIQLFEHVLSFNPNDIESTSNIGNAYLSLAEQLRLKLKSSQNEISTPKEVQELKADAIRNYQMAIPYLEKALNVKPDQPSLWRNLGVAYINTGQKEKGEQAFVRAEDLKVKSEK